MRVAALDFGSNTFLLLIADLKKTATGWALEKVICDEVTLTRLSEGVDKTKMLSAEALSRSEDCFKKYSQLIAQHNPEKVIAVTTSATRDATNKKDFFNLCDKYNIPIHLASGDLEAELTFSGATFDKLEKNNCAVIDIGGGSTEFIFNGKEFFAKSLDVGSVRLTERFLHKDIISDQQIKATQSYVFSELQNYYVNAQFQINSLIAVAGTPTTLSCVHQSINFMQEKVHGSVLTKYQIEELRDKLAAMPLQERIKVKGLEPKRADVIVAGCCIMLAHLDFFNVSEISVSTYGVRYGVALGWEKF